MFNMILTYMIMSRLYELTAHFEQQGFTPFDASKTALEFLRQEQVSEEGKRDERKDIRRHKDECV